MKTDYLECHTLLERAAIQDRTADLAAELAQEAEETGQLETAKIAWTVVRRSRVQALKLRAQAVTKPPKIDRLPGQITNSGGVSTLRRSRGFNIRSAD